MTVIKSGDALIDTGGADGPLGPYRAELISDSAGLTQFGAFIEELPPGSHSSHTHWHATEHEMILILCGTATLTEGEAKTELNAGDAACWKAGEPVGHSLENLSDAPVRYVVIGTRAPHDVITYPTHDRILHYDRTTNTRSYTTLDGAPATHPETA
ncbi:cupin domain-containing protein [uncultured Tateyamaria sp.]|uniref:cupin domain-containing protein n=1 Tax=uncultured Tateyamaria sp. TaxID=455651 RepID=UPI00262AFEA4|nr:cupin domain-containing protein [uncultured Tateyamaria sp.]